MNNAFFPLLLLCLGSILIGASAPFVRLSELDPLATGFYRMLFSLPFFLFWMREERKEPLDYKALVFHHGLGILLAGFFFALDLGLWNWSVGHTTIVNSSLFNNTSAFFIPLTLWLIYKDTPSVRVVLTALIGFLGCTFLVGESLSISYDNLAGDAVALLSGVTVALYIIALQKTRAHLSTGTLMFATSLCTTLFLGLFCYLTDSSFWPLGLRDIVSVLGLAFLVQVCGQGLFAYSLSKVPTAYAGISLFLAPATAAALGWVFYGESLSHFKLFGMALIMVSIFTIKRKD